VRAGGIVDGRPIKGEAHVFQLLAEGGVTLGVVVPGSTSHRLETDARPLDRAGSRCCNEARRAVDRMSTTSGSRSAG